MDTPEVVEVDVVCQQHPDGDRVVQRFYRVPAELAADGVGGWRGSDAQVLEGITPSAELTGTGTRRASTTRLRWVLQCTCGTNATATREQLVPILDRAAEIGWLPLQGLAETLSDPNRR